MTIARSINRLCSYINPHHIISTPQYSFLRDKIVDNFYASLEKVRKSKINALVVDLTNNGGGTNWVQRVTALLTKEKIICERRGFVKHSLHIKNFKELLEDVKRNSPNDQKRISAMEENIETASEVCDLTPIWTKKSYKPNCSLVGYRKDDTCNYEKLKFPGKTKYDGKLFLLVNGKTSSAAEDMVARHLDSKTARVIGSRTHGSGCGYMNGGIQYKLPNSKLDVKVPDCIRERANGTNEVVGIDPNINLDMSTIKNNDFLPKLISLITNNI